MNSDNLPRNEPSVCIPRTFGNITQKQVKNVFEQILGVGTVDKVDLIMRRDKSGREFQRVFVHFKEWPTHDHCNRFRDKLLQGDEVKLVYNEPWFWKCRKSNSTRPSNRRQTTHPTPYIDYGSDDSHCDDELNLSKNSHNVAEENC